MIWLTDVGGVFRSCFGAKLPPLCYVVRGWVVCQVRGEMWRSALCAQRLMTIWSMFSKM